MATAKIKVGGVWIPYLNGEGQAPITLSHTFAVGGTVAVPSGDADYILPFFVSVTPGRTALLKGCRYRINSGTSATIKVQINGADAAGFIGMSATTTPTSTTPTAINLVNEDMIALVVTAVSGTPKNLSCSLFLEYA